MTTAVLPAPAPPVAHVTRLVAAAAMAFASQGLMVALYGVALPGWVAALGLGEGRGTQLLSAHGAGAFLTLMALIAGVRALSLRVGLIAMGAGALIVAREGAWPLMLAGAALGGAGFGIIGARMSTRLLSETGPRGSAIVGTLMALFAVGGLVAPLLHLRMGAPPVLLVVAVMAAVAALILPVPLHPAPPRGWPAMGRAAWVTLGAIAVSATVEVGLTGLGPTALAARGFAPDAVAWLAALFFVSFAAGRGSLWLLARRLAPRALALVSLLGSAAACVLAAAGAEAVGFVLAGAVVGIIFPSLFVRLMAGAATDPRMGASAMAAGLLAQAVAPLVLAPLLVAWGDGALFAIMVPPALGAAMLAARR